MTARGQRSRRVLIAGSASALAASGLARTAAAFQADRDLLDLLASQELLQIAHYTALLETFDDSVFVDAGYPDGTRSKIESILTAEESHLAALMRPDTETAPGPATPVHSDLIEAMSEAAELENLAVASYAFAIPEMDRQRLVPLLVGIHSVEARHAAWLATVVGTDPFPDVIDTALTLGESGSGPAATVTAPATAGTPTVGPEIAPLVAAIAQDLKVPVDSVQIVTAEPRDWPDSSLGCPQPDMLYAQVVTPGYLVLVEVSGEQIEYHTDKRGSIVRCP
jgi:hypothetical protein